MILENVQYKILKDFSEVRSSQVRVFIDNINKLNELYNKPLEFLIDKEYVKVRKDTFASMQNVIKETKKVMEFQPKMEQLFNEVNTFSKSHQTLEKENNTTRKIKFL